MKNRAILSQRVFGGVGASFETVIAPKSAWSICPLSVFPSSIVWWFLFRIFPGIVKYDSVSFEQGVTDSITLLQAGSSSKINCYWDLTGAGLTQKIPTEQPSGSYSMDMTITATAY